MTQGPSQNLIPLTQLSLSEMLGGALNSLRRMPKTMLGIGLFAAFIIELSSLLVSALIIRGGGDLTAPVLPEPTGTFDQEQIQELLNALIPSLQAAAFAAVVLFFVQLISTTLFTHVVGNAITGRKLNANEAWQKAKPQLFRVFLISLLGVILPLASLILGFAIGIGLGSSIPGSFGVFITFTGLGIGLFGAIYLWTGLYVSVPTLILEDSLVFISLKRSFALSKSMMFRVFGIGLVGVIASQALSIVVATPFTLFASVGNLENPNTTSVFFNSMGSIMGYTVMLPFMAAFTVLLYTDLRIRKENLANQLNQAKNQ